MLHLAQAINLLARSGHPGRYLKSVGSDRLYDDAKGDSKEKRLKM